MKTAKAVFVVLCTLLASKSAMADVSIPFITGTVFYSAPHSDVVNNATVYVCSQPYIDYANCRTVLSEYTGQYDILDWWAPDTAKIYFFAWIDAPYAADGRIGRWGSSTVYLKTSSACQSRDQWGYCHNYGVLADLTLEPAPLTPTAVYPAANATNFPTHTPTFKWTSSQDSWRSTPVLYEIWGSGYDAPMIRQVSNLPCNPDAMGRCQWTLPIDLLPNTPFNWKIVAKVSYPGHTFVTESVTYHFTSGN